MHAAVDMKNVAVSVLQTGLDKLHVPYSYGWSIILLTLLVKTALFPITRKQVGSREKRYHDWPVHDWPVLEWLVRDWLHCQLLSYLTWL